MVERDEQIVNLNQMVTDRDREVVSLGQAMVERDEQIISLNQAANENRLIVRQILSSNSWRVTSPLRKVKSFFRRK